MPRRISSVTPRSNSVPGTTSDSLAVPGADRLGHGIDPVRAVRELDAEHHAVGRPGRDRSADTTPA